MFSKTYPAIDPLTTSSLATIANWKVYDPLAGERWHGFEFVRPLAGISDDIVLLPLRGHTYGHAGVAVRGEEGWLLNAADAYFHHSEMNLCRPHCPIGLRFYQWMMQKDREARLSNQQRLRELAAQERPDVRIFAVTTSTSSKRWLAVPLHSLLTPSLPHVTSRQGCNKCLT
jgi:hypothetical protein